MGVTLGTYGATGASGWTSITASADTNIIYVSDSTGNDAWDGSQPAFTSGIHGPVKTLIKAFGGTGPGVIADPNNTGTTNGDGTGLGTRGAGNNFALRTGHFDWVLLKGGDTWISQAIETGFNAGASDNFGLSGAGPTEPLVIAAFDVNTPTIPNPGTVGPATILVPGGVQDTTAATSGRDGLKYQGVNATGYVALLGVVFYNAQRDPNNGTYYQGDANIVDVSGINVTTTAYASDAMFLIEDCKFKFFFQGTFFNSWRGNLYVRRSMYQHNYSLVNGRAQGLVLDDVEPVTVDENLFDSNGQLGNLVGGSTQGRNSYLQWNSNPVTWRGNFNSRSASEGTQFRGVNPTVFDSSFIQNPIGFEIGHNEGQPTITSGSISYNVVMNSTAILGTDGTETGPGASPRGQGISFLNCSSAAISLSYNIIAHVTQSSATNVTGIITDAINTKYGLGQTLNAGSGGTNNSFHSLVPLTDTGLGTGTGGKVEFTNTGTGTLPSGILITDDYGDNNSGYQIGDVCTIPSTGGIPSGATIQVISIFTAGVHGISMNATNIIFDWKSTYVTDNGGTNDGGAANNFSTTNDSGGYPNPTRNIGTYAATLGLTASLDGFVSVAMAMSRSTWNYNLMAPAFNNYIRAGFGIGGNEILLGQGMM